MSDLKILFKKQTYPINSVLMRYLDRYNRISKVYFCYDDLLHYTGSVSVYDKNGIDTLWIRVYYSQFEQEEIDYNLKQIYSLLHSDGNLDIIPFLTVDGIDYCTFGNSRPFRIKIRNNLNDNYTYFYIKKADASRIYGLELEHILSPDKINFLVYEDTLIEEHIAGIAGDVFIKKTLEECSESEKAQIAKEFVKFNERCMIRLLGDMRSYNYVIVPTHDFDQVIYKIRAIDFDQQSYEGNFKVYRPQFFKENYPMIRLVKDKLQERSIEQYKKEERAVLAKRMISAGTRIQKLILIMKDDAIAPDAHVLELKKELFAYTKDLNFKNAKTMGHIIYAAFQFVTRNYKNMNPFNE